MEEEFSFTLDGVLKQRAQGKHMSHDPAECLSYVSQFFPVCAGDLLFTGTPVGVGSVSVGQTGAVRYGSIHYQVKWTELV
jgi:2-keto-4-pentenoate hydratase/2-oxohepta-3-ene-1,7-dioic acid hydratase in catechol pathway